MLIESGHSLIRILYRGCDRRWRHATVCYWSLVTVCGWAQPPGIHHLWSSSFVVVTFCGRGKSVVPRSQFGVATEGINRLPKFSMFKFSELAFQFKKNPVIYDFLSQMILRFLITGLLILYSTIFLDFRWFYVSHWRWRSLDTERDLVSFAFDEPLLLRYCKLPPRGRLQWTTKVPEYKKTLKKCS